MVEKRVSVECEALHLLPALESMRTDEVLYGMRVYERSIAVNERHEMWSFVTTEYGYSGYIMSNSLYDTGNDRVADNLEEVFVIKGFADVHAAAGIKSTVLITLSLGARLMAVNDCIVDGWQEVRLLDGTEGYIRQAFLMKVKGESKAEELLRQNIASAAELFLNCQYRWGGKSFAGIDCSGLTFMAYYLNGITIYRDSELKSGYPVKKIPVSNAKMADLLYFKGHVALYLGNGNYIHSTLRAGSDGVVMNSLDKENPAFRQDLAESLLYAGSIFTK